jgi:hypothetical protein
VELVADQVSAQDP